MTPNVATQTEALVIVEAADGIATITLNRPGQFNALSQALIDETQSALDDLAADPTVRVVVLAARGRGFCSGHDLKEIRAMAQIAEVEALFERCSRMIQLEMPLGEAYSVAGHAIACDFFTEDGKEGVEAFLGKRTPRCSNQR